VAGEDPKKILDDVAKQWDDAPQDGLEKQKAFTTRGRQKSARIEVSLTA